MTKEQKTELEAILKKSEIHAMTCTIDRGITNNIFRSQIEKGYLTVSVSSKMVGKAIRVFELFLRRMLKEGFSLTLDCRTHYHCPASAIVVDGEIIPVRLKEKRELRFKYYGTSKRGEYIPTGVLAFEIYGGTSWEATKVLVASESQKWPQVFEGVIPYLHRAASRLKANRLASEEWHRKMQEEERKRKEHEQMIEKRASVVESIMHDVGLYEKAETIRRYCNIAEQLTSSEKDRERMATARQIADWIDPTTDYIDEILSVRYCVEDFLDN